MPAFYRQIPLAYHGITRWAQIRLWLQRQETINLGNLVLANISTDNLNILCVSTAGLTLAFIEVDTKIAHVLYDIPDCTRAQAGYRNRLLEALSDENYQITEVPDSDVLRTVMFAVVCPGRDGWAHFNEIEVVETEEELAHLQRRVQLEQRAREAIGAALEARLRWVPPTPY